MHKTSVDLMLILQVSIEGSWAPEKDGGSSYGRKTHSEDADR